MDKLCGIKRQEEKGEALIDDKYENIYYLGNRKSKGLVDPS